MLLLDKCSQKEYTQTEMGIYLMHQIEFGMKQISIMNRGIEEAAEFYFRMMD